MNDRLLGGITLLVLAVACVVGSVTMHRQSRQLEELSMDLSRQRVLLQERMVASPVPQVPSPQAPTPVATGGEDLKPVVAYLRSGLLTAEERQMLERNLAEPIGDYYNATARYAVAILVEVPVASKMPYGVTIITTTGTAEFQYGRRGEDVGYWLPDCADQGDCSFTEAFKQKYPTIVSRYPEVREGVSAE